MKRSTIVTSPYDYYTLAIKEDIANVIRHNGHLVPMKPEQIGHIPDELAEILLDNFIIYKKEK